MPVKLLVSVTRVPLILLVRALFLLLGVEVKVSPCIFVPLVTFLLIVFAVHSMLGTRETVMELLPGSSIPVEESIHNHEMGLSDVSTVCLGQTAEAAALACSLEIFVAILTLLHCLPTGLL